MPPRAASPSVSRPAIADEIARNGEADVFVVLREQADLSDLGEKQNRVARLTDGYRTLTKVAERSQRGVRQELRDRGAEFEQFWIINAVHVAAVDAELALTLSERPEVEGLREVGAITVPRLNPTEDPGGADGVEWNVSRIGAEEVWGTHDTRGEGIVVANIDTGVDMSHPALASQYRGFTGDASPDHAYNWFDPRGVCGALADGPCDNQGHGTHTMGTMVGDDGAGNQIGVAPKATWIAAKGCETSVCSVLSLLQAGQWVAAPTDLAGQNPRPDLAPHIVNNSWGGGGGDPWYTQVVETWVDLGIFPVFAAGNSGPGCGTAGSPGDYATAYAVGALDAGDQVASFSSRGAGGFGGVKPNIAAPGVGVRSAIPGGYRAFSGTSMAAPHVAGAVAMMWSAAPTLVGDVSRTRALLDTTAVDVADTSCGGTAANNNVYGEGRLDAAAAVAAAPQEPTGTLTGAVVSDETDGPVGFATIRVAGEGGRARTAVADAQGLFSLVVPAGLNTVTADAFGYLPREVDVPVAEGEVQHVQIDLASAPRYTVSGTVHDLFGAPVVGARVVLAGVPLPGGVTDETGGYQIPDVPAGEYTLEVPESGCAARTSTVVTVAGDTEANLVVPPRDDGVAYSCRAKPLEWIAGTDLVPLTGIDDVVTIDLPFEFHMYGPQESPIGRRASKAHVATNGFVGFDRPNDLHINRPVPSVGNPSCAIFPFWDDLVVDEQASVQTALVGTAPNRRFAIEWRNVTFWQGTGRVTFEVVLHEDGTIDLQYLELTGGRGWGTSATVAVESCNGGHALQYSHSEPSLTSGQAIRFNPGSEVDGTVLDATGSPVEFADIRALKAGTSVVAAETSADGDGAFTLPVLPGLYTVEASRLGYQPVRSQLHVTAEGVAQDFVLEGVRNDVSGFVLDDLGLPAVDATVELQHGPGAGEEIATVTVDPDGFFRFEDVPAGDGSTSYYYNVRVHGPASPRTRVNAS